MSSMCNRYLDQNKKIMASPQKKSSLWNVVCWIWFDDLNATKAHKWVTYGSPSDKMLKAWRDKFLATGSVLKSSLGARKGLSEKVETIRTAFANNPMKSSRRTSLEVRIPKSTEYLVLNRKFRLHAKRVQLMCSTYKRMTCQRGWNFLCTCCNALRMILNF